MIPDTPAHLPPARPNLKAFRPPKSQSKIAYVIWRIQMWIEGTFALGMLEPWEKILLLIIFMSIFTLLLTGVIRYLPHHISVMKSRSVYYLWGNDSGESPVLQWFGKSSGNSASSMGGEL